MSYSLGKYRTIDVNNKYQIKVKYLRFAIFLS